MTNVPDAELHLFLDVVTRALDQARAGQVADGWDLLSRGVARAEVLEADGEPGAAELVVRYWEARDRYAQEWGVPQVE